MFKAAQRDHDVLQGNVRTHVKQRKIDRNINDMTDGGKMGLIASKNTVEKRPEECYSWLQYGACYDKSKFPRKHPVDRKGLGTGASRSSTPKGKRKGKKAGKVKEDKCQGKKEERRQVQMVAVIMVTFLFLVLAATVTSSHSCCRAADSSLGFSV